MWAALRQSGKSKAKEESLIYESATIAVSFAARFSVTSFSLAPEGGLAHWEAMLIEQ